MAVLIFSNIKLVRKSSIVQDFHVYDNKFMKTIRMFFCEKSNKDLDLSFYVYK
jgi:hypothetical protein